MGLRSLWDKIRDALGRPAGAPPPGMSPELRQRLQRAIGRVAVDAERICYSREGHEEQSMAWQEITCIEVVTTDEGPFAEDVFLVFHGAGDKPGLVVPQGAQGNEELADRVVQLPGFDHEAFIAAMGSTSNARFLCWRKAP